MEIDMEVQSLTKQQSHSGNLSYSKPIIIHETSKTRVEFIPWYIPRSTGTELHAKIVTNKRLNTGPFDWGIKEEKSITLNAEAVQKLAEVIKQCQAVANKGEDGSYITIKVQNGVADIANLSSETLTSAVAGLLSHKDIAKHLSCKELGPQLVEAFRGSIRLYEIRSAVLELRHLLDSGEIDEKIYQRWCQQHTWAFGNAYLVSDETRNISAGDSVDLLLPTAITGFRDIVELKRPDMEPLMWDNAHKYYYFSADVSKAIGQCHRYLDVFSEDAIDGLRDHGEIVAYHPRSIIVIGRSTGWDKNKLKALHGLNSRLATITVMTFDQLLAQGERLVEILNTPAEDSTSATNQFGDPTTNDEPPNDDDIPF